jgi:hypothetical protein
MKANIRDPRKHARSWMSQSRRIALTLLITSFARRFQKACELVHKSAMASAEDTCFVTADGDKIIVDFDFPTAGAWAGDDPDYRGCGGCAVRTSPLSITNVFPSHTHLLTAPFPLGNRWAIVQVISSCNDPRLNCWSAVTEKGCFIESLCRWESH